MMRALTAGALYFAIVFAAGFALGALRTLYVAQRFGELAATLFELPLILLAAWFVSARVAAALRVGRALAPRLAMGATAFALLMAAEAALSVVLFGGSLRAHIAGYAEPPQALGLAGQALFALFPALQGRRSR